MTEQQEAALRAADEAERLLPLFEAHYPEDMRPRQAIEALRAWVRGELRVGQGRAAALAAHAAARAAEYPAARFAARAAGQAASVAHMIGHARGVPYYAAKAERAWDEERQAELERGNREGTEGDGDFEARSRSRRRPAACGKS